MELNRLFSRIYSTSASQFGLNPMRFIRAISRIPQFLKEYNEFKKNYKGLLLLAPHLHERFDESGETKSEYFLQDLIIAKRIFNSSPKKHIDIGSRIDGFVAHVASFRELEVLDIRPITQLIPGIVFRQVDVMNLKSSIEISSLACDSLSCLHTIEHFGLGRYGDPINVNGFVDGIRNIASLLTPDGVLYLSTPIGKERVEFNANRVFNPFDILREAEKHRLKLVKLTTIKNSEVLEHNITREVLSDLADEWYSLGVFEFVKLR